VSYGTEVKLLGIWLVVAVVAAVVLMVVLLVRQPPAEDQFWRTVRRYFLLSAMICTCLPVLILVVRTVDVIYEWAYPTLLGYWWVPILVVAVLALGVGGWLLWRWERPRPSEESAEVVEAPQIAVQPMWSMPADTQQWDADSLPR
jgi:uncharacterized membrane protein